MNSEYIKEYPSQKIIGVIRTESNGDQTALDYPSYKILGVYKKASNSTFEYPSYRKVSDGNTVMRFIYTKK